MRKLLRRFGVALARITADLILRNEAVRLLKQHGRQKRFAFRVLLNQTLKLKWVVVTFCAELHIEQNLGFQGLEEATQGGVHPGDHGGVPDALGALATATVRRET